MACQAWGVAEGVPSWAALVPTALLGLVPAALLLSLLTAPPQIRMHFHAGQQELVQPGSQRPPVRRSHAAAVHVRQQNALQ